MYNDINIKIEHSPVTTYDTFNVNQVGVDDPIIFSAIPGAPSYALGNYINPSGGISDASIMNGLGETTNDIRTYFTVASGETILKRVYIKIKTKGTGYTDLRVEIHDASHAQQGETAIVLFADIVVDEWLPCDIPVTLSTGTTYHYHLYSTGTVTLTPDVYCLSPGSNDKEMLYLQYYTADPGTTPEIDASECVLFSDHVSLSAAITATTEYKPYVLIDVFDYPLLTINEDISGATFDNLLGFYVADCIEAQLCTRLLGYTPSDSNTIYFAKYRPSGIPASDSNNGSYSEPKLTVEGAIAAITATKTKIVCSDSGTYTANAIELTGNFTGMYAAIGQSPTISLTPYRLVEDNASNALADTLINTNDYASSGVSYKSGFTQGLDNGNLVLYYNKKVTATSSWGAYAQVVSPDGTVVVSEIAIKDVASNRWLPVGITKLPNGNVVFAYVHNNTPYELCYKTYTPDLATLVVAEVYVQNVYSLNTVYYDRPAFDISGLSDNGVVVTWTELDPDVATYNRWRVFDATGTAVTSVQTIGSTGAECIASCGLLNTDGFAILLTYRVSGELSSTRVQLAIFENDGTVRSALATIKSSDDYGVSACDCEASVINDDIFIAYDDTDLRYQIYNSSGTQVKSETTITTENFFADVRIAPSYEGGWVVCYLRNATNYYVTVRAYDYSGTAIGAGATTIYNIGSSTVYFLHITQLLNGTFGIFYFRYVSSNLYAAYYTIWNINRIIHIKASNDATINGINISVDHPVGTLLRAASGGSLQLGWCSIDGNSDSNDTYAFSVCRASDAININNSIISNFNYGVIVDADECVVQDSQLYWIYDGYAIDIDGAATSTGDITIEHCDIFDCYGGIHLENNDGTNEVIKNNIIHNNSNYGIDAENTITISNTVITDPTSGVTDGSSVFHVNPAYVNEGAVTPSSIDLTIKTKMTGYRIDSPAYWLADDDRNAGAFNVYYISSDTTWTSMTIEKPKKIDRWIDPVGEIKTEKKDGSVSTYKEAMTEYMVLDYDAMLNADWAKVVQLFGSTSSQVRIYEDPDTYPYDYSTWSFVYNKLGKGAKHYKLTRTGVHDVTLTFARAYEVE